MTMAMVPPPAASATRVAAAEGEDSRMARGSVVAMPAAVRREARALSGETPGRSVTVRQVGGRPGMTPAWTKELLPAPVGTTTTCSGRWGRRVRKGADYQ